jgi:hypothetical protein
MGMSLSELEQCVFAYFLSHDALNVTVDGRFYRREEFVRVFEDRFFYALQLYGRGIAGRHSNIANALVDKLIEERALSTVVDRLTGISHQFDTGRYRALINNLIKSNDICQRSQAAGPQFWEEAFAAFRKNGDQPN